MNIERLFPDYVYKSIREFRNTALPVELVKELGVRKCKKHLKEYFNSSVVIKRAFYSGSKWLAVEDKEYYIAELL